MKLPSLAQPPFDTSLMGVLWGAARYHRFDHSRGMLYGGSGHAFLINIHNQLCPSGPYVWNHEPLYALTRNLGVDVKVLSYEDETSGTVDRTQLEEAIRRRLDAGVPCGIVNLDHQLVLGYDEAGLILALPWGDDAPTTPPRLAATTWAEFGEELHVEAYELRRTEPADPRETVLASLAFAAELWASPRTYAYDDYRMGPEAYESWISAIRGGHAGGHGAWWNACVWSECRDAAKEYLREIARHFPETADLAHELSGRYGSIASNIRAAGERSLPAEKKIEHIETARGLEAESISGLAAVADVISRSA